jgi:hypothetical protein
LFNLEQNKNEINTSTRQREKIDYEFGPIKWENTRQTFSRRVIWKQNGSQRKRNFFDQ